MLLFYSLKIDLSKKVYFSDFNFEAPSPSSSEIYCDIYPNVNKMINLLSLKMSDF